MQGCVPGGGIVMSGDLTRAPHARAPVPNSQEDSTARDIRPGMGEQKLPDQDGAKTLLQVPRNYFAPDTMGPASQDVAQFLHFREAAHNMGEYSVKFDLLRLKAKGLLRNLGAFPDAFAAAPCPQNASSSKCDESPILATTHGTSAMLEIAQQLRRFLARMAPLGKKMPTSLIAESRTYRPPRGWGTVNRVYRTVNQGNSQRRSPFGLRTR